MPEGDTLHKLARYLSPRLRGQVLEPIDIPNALAPSSSMTMKWKKFSREESIS